MSIAYVGRTLDKNTLLWLIAEEACELAARASKIARFGSVGTDLHELTNTERMWCEVDDLIAALIEYAKADGRGGIDFSNVEKKREKVRQLATCKKGGADVAEASGCPIGR